MALAKINGKWKRVKTIDSNPYSSSVIIRTGKKRKTINRSKYAKNRNQIPLSERRDLK